MAEGCYVWPDWMPRPEQDGFTIQPVDTRVRSDMEIGSVLRVEFDTDAQTATASLVLDQMQAAWLEAFEQRLLSQGAQWFRFPLWIAGRVQYQLVRMRERPKFSRTQGLYSTYALSLDVAGRDLMSADMAEALLYFNPAQLIDLSDRLHVILHVDAPGVSLIPGDFWPPRAA